MNWTHIGTPSENLSNPLEDLAARWSKSASKGKLTQVEAYWHALRGDAIAPYRSQIDPRGIEMALADVCIIERIASGHGRVRIAGSHLSDLMGMEIRGMPFSAMFEPIARDALQSRLSALFDDPAIVRFDLVSEGSFGKPRLTAHLSLLPLRDDNGLITRAIGCFGGIGDFGRAPRRFCIQSARCDPLQAPQKPTVQVQTTINTVENRENLRGSFGPYLRLVTDNT